MIHNVDTDDMGSYLCIADNGVPPIVSKRIYVYVQCKEILSIIYFLLKCLIFL